MTALAVWAAAGASSAEVGRFEQANRVITTEWELTPGGRVREAAFNVELRDPTRPDVAGGRSMTGAASVDCSRRMVRLARLVVHADPGLKGAEVRRFAQQTAWVRPEPSSVLSAVVQAVCDASARTLSTPLTRAAAPTPPTAVPVQAPAPVARTRAPAATPSASAQGEFRIQVGSFPSRADAEVRVAALRQDAPAMRSARLEAARVGSIIYHRVLIDGFTSAATAEAACRELRASGSPCLVKTGRR